MDKLKQKRAELNAKINAILACDPMTDAQVAEHDKLVAEYEANEKHIARQVAADARDTQAKAEAAHAAELAETERVARERAERQNAGSRRITEPDSSGNIKTSADGRERGSFEDTDEKVTIVIGETADAVRRRSYAEMKQQNARAMKTAGYVPRGEFTSMADMIRAGFDSKDKFKTRLEKHVAPLLDARGNFLNPQAAVQGHSEGVATDGGFFVIPEFGGRIIDRVFNNNLWSRTDNYSVNGNSMTFLASSETSRATGSRAGGLRGYWMSGEGADLTKSKTGTREVSLKLAKLGIVVYFTQELLDDGGAALESYVTQKAAEEFNFMIGDALINGTGAGQPLGILNCPSLVSVAKETGQTAATIQNENIEKMYARFYAPNMPNAYWYTNQDTGPQLNQMTLGIGTGGVPTYMPPGGASAAPYGVLKGRPVEATEFNATLGTQGDLICADLKQILSISKGGIFQAQSMHIQFLTDQLAVRFIMRLNAGPWESAPLTPYKGTSNTQSSFVTLDTRA